MILDKDRLLIDKIRTQREIAALSPKVTEHDRIQGTLIARKLWRLQTEINLIDEALHSKPCPA